MAQVFLSFTAENDEELLKLVLGYASRCSKPPSWLGETAPPIDPGLVEDQATLSDEQWDAKHDHAPERATPEAAPEQEPAPKARKPRAARAAPAPEPEPAPAPAPEPAPASPAPPARELPALDTLKSVVTTAVRLAQKGEGPKKILELLPAFKDTTGLDFVMNAEDKHRVALYDLVSAADLPVV